jgi:hypothetical protein
LIGHGLDRGGGSLGVEVVGRPGRVHGLVVELITERDTGRDVERDDFLIRQPVEVLHQGTQRVAVGGHQHDTVPAQVRHDRVVPVGQQPPDDILEALGARHRLEQVRIPGVGCGALLVIRQRRRRRVVRPAPAHELLIAELRVDRHPVHALQRAIVPLVEPPRTAHRDPVPVRDVEADLGSPDRAAKQRGVQHVRKQVVLDKEIPRAARLALAGRR